MAELSVYEIVVEVQDGAHSYTVRELVVAETNRTARRYARQFAARLYPHARHDNETDVWSDGDGREWYVARVAPLSEMLVPMAGRQRNVRVALVPQDGATSPCSLPLAASLDFVRA